MILNVSQHILQISLQTRSSSDRQVAADSHEAAPAGGPGVHCNTIKMYLFYSMPLPSLCHFSGRPDFRRQLNALKTAVVTRNRKKEKKNC